MITYKNIKLDHVFCGTVPRASNLPSLKHTSEVFVVIQTYILYHHMLTHTGFLNKFECTASFQLSAEVQTPSAEQAQVQAAGREKYIFSKK
jgi:hypothetical protein